MMMAFCDDREDGGQDDDWKGLLMDARGQEDALFKSLDDDEQEDTHEDVGDDLFLMQPMDVPLDLVERLSWDAASQESGDGDEGLVEPTLPTLRPLQVGIALRDTDLQWGLISPCSETSSPQRSSSTMLSPLTRSVSISSPGCQRRFFEPEPEHEVPCEQVQASTPQKIAKEEEKEQEKEKEEEEVTVHDPETCFSPDTNRVLSSPVASISGNPFTTYQPASDEDNQPSPRVSALRPSLLPRVPSIAHWRRQKARTSSGVGLAGTPTVLCPATLKTSLSRSRNRSVDDEDDGDFSSDDEGYAPELRRCPASETERLDASQWRRARRMSLNFPSHRLSVNVSMKPALITKRLQEAKDKLNSGLHLLRSGSSVSTVMSEMSYLESPVCQEIKSAPAGTYREPSIFEEATATSLVSAASACTIGSDAHHPTRQQQLRAGVFRAAGLLNAASAEAARKLKSRGFHAPHLPRQKAAEDPELSSTYPINLVVAGIK